MLRDLRAKATRNAADTYAATSPQETRPIDERHDRLRGLEGLLMQLEEQPRDNRPAGLTGHPVAALALSTRHEERCPGEGSPYAAVSELDE